MDSPRVLPSSRAAPRPPLAVSLGLKRERWRAGLKGRSAWLAQLAAPWKRFDARFRGQRHYAWAAMRMIYFFWPGLRRIDRNAIAEPEISSAAGPPQLRAARAGIAVPSGLPWGDLARAAENGPPVESFVSRNRPRTASGAGRRSPALAWPRPGWLPWPGFLSRQRGQPEAAAAFSQALAQPLTAHAEAGAPVLPPRRLAGEPEYWISPKAYLPQTWRMATGPRRLGDVVGASDPSVTPGSAMRAAGAHHPSSAASTLRLRTLYAAHDFRAAIRGARPYPASEIGGGPGAGATAPLAQVWQPARTGPVADWSGGGTPDVKPRAATPRLRRFASAAAPDRAEIPQRSPEPRGAPPLSQGDARNERTPLQTAGFGRRASQPESLPTPSVGAGQPPPLTLHAGPGSPLDPALRSRFERLLNFDLGRVRIHTDGAAAAAAFHLRARAFTLGSDVFFAPGALQPQNPRGLALMVHEFSHVAQQPGGLPVAAGQLKPAERRTMEQEARARTERLLAGGYRPGVSTIGRTDTMRGSPYPTIEFCHAARTVSVVPLLEEAAAEPAPAPAPAPAVGRAEPAAPSGAADAEGLAEEVYRLIQQRWRIERERRGIQPWT